MTPASTDGLVDLLVQALRLALVVVAPPLGAALVAGLVTGAMQAVTRVEDAAISMVPRVAAVLLALVVAAPWSMAELSKFTQMVLLQVAAAGRSA